MDIKLSEEPDSDFKSLFRGWRRSTLDFETIAVQSTVDPKITTSSGIMPAIVTSSVFICEGHFSPILEFQKNDGSEIYFYARYGNPVRNLLESCLAKLDGAEYAMAFSSGMAAATSVLLTCRQGDHVVAVGCLNGDTDWICRNKVLNFGISVDFVHSVESENILAVLKPETKIVWLESPQNPTMRLVDIEKISRKVHDFNPEILVVLDNTLLTSVFQQPFELGVDVVVYSSTKYHAGHADVTMGAAVFNSESLYNRIRENQIHMGGHPSSFDCYLLIRSLKTLPLRMKKHFKNALKVAHFLQKQPNVLKVCHPGLPSHPDHALALKQQSGHSGVLSFYIDGGVEESKALLRALKIFRPAGSFGSDVSLACLPKFSSQIGMRDEEKLKFGITSNLIRLSVGIEGAERLIQDLDQALRTVRGCARIANGH